MSVSNSILIALLVVLGYLVAPVSLVWGWMRWIKRRPRQLTIPSSLSLAGFILASASAAFALWTIAYGSGGRFESDYPLFYRDVAWGVDLSLGGFVFGIGGIWRENSLRWFAPAGTIGMLAFWIVASNWP